MAQFFSAARQVARLAFYPVMGYNKLDYLRRSLRE